MSEEDKYTAKIDGRTKLIEIKKSSDLIPGKHYYCFSRETGLPSIVKCNKDDIGNGPFLSNNDSNNTQFETWMIFGPVVIPTIFTTGLCREHSGTGFVSDCFICNKRKNTTIGDNVEKEEQKTED